MISEYLLNRSNLMCLFILIDCRHTPQQIDQEFMQWLAEKEIPFEQKRSCLKKLSCIRWNGIGNIL